MVLYYVKDDLNFKFIEDILKFHLGIDVIRIENLDSVEVLHKELGGEIDLILLSTMLISRGESSANKVDLISGINIKNEFVKINKDFYSPRCVAYTASIKDGDRDFLLNSGFADYYGVLNGNGTSEVDSIVQFIIRNFERLGIENKLKLKA